MEFLGSDKVKVRVKFEGCACGLDYPQYIIDSVVYTDSGWDAAYLNKNVYLQTTSIKHKSLLQMTQASGCYTWIIKGKIQKNGYGMHQLIIETVERFIDKNCLED